MKLFCHEPRIMGTHGIGVGTPCALALAELTIGLARLVHRPMDPMFTRGLESVMFAAGSPLIGPRFTGRTLSVPSPSP